MPDFRMHEPVHGLSVNDDAASDACADRDIEAALFSPGCAHARFRQRRRVDIRIQGSRNMKRVPERLQQRETAPGELGRLGDGTVSGRISVQIQRSEAADSQGADAGLREEGRHFRHGLVRRAGRQHRLPDLIGVFIHDGQHHFGAARFQGSVVFHRFCPPGFFRLCRRFVRGVCFQPGTRIRIRRFPRAD